MKKFKTLLSLFLIILIIIAAFISYKKLEKSLYPIKYSEYVTKYSKQYNLDPTLIYAVIKCESSFRPHAVSKDDAIGLMQITPNTYKWLVTKTKNPAKEVDINDLFNEETNIKFGCFLLRLHLNEFNDTRMALAAYHAGRGAVNDWLKDLKTSKDGKTLDNIPYLDTSSYVDKVIRVQEKYNKLYNLN